MSYDDELPVPHAQTRPLFLVATLLSGVCRESQDRPGSVARQTEGWGEDRNWRVEGERHLRLAAEREWDGALSFSLSSSISLIISVLFSPRQGDGVS